MIRFYSTNQKAPQVPFHEALRRGQAPDRGLYLPETLPRFAPEEWESLRSKSYPEIAAAILGHFIGELVEPERLLALCQEAYDFPVPIETVFTGCHVLRLDQGPTASFKDFAARMMARLFGAFYGNTGERLVVLTATSGDTGSAVANAFYRVPGIDVMILFPEKEVSDRQRRQMTTLGENITVVSVRGKFDDCQALVKQAFADPDLSKLALTSANSINVGRLLPQIVYYGYAYLQTAAPGEKSLFSIPSGNFGNMMGGLLAWRMGLPIRRLVIATNANDEVPVFLRTGEYRKIVPSRECLSNAMNVGHPSNFARVVDLYGGLMDETGHILRPPDLEAMRRDLWAISISDEETRETIQSAWEQHRLLLEPHGAVAWAALARYLAESPDPGPCIVIETAHPAKFPEEIESLLGFSPEVPPSLKGLEAKPEYMISLSANYAALKSLLKDLYGP